MCGMPVRLQSKIMWLCMIIHLMTRTERAGCRLELEKEILRLILKRRLKQMLEKTFLEQLKARLQNRRNNKNPLRHLRKAKQFHRNLLKHF